MPSNIKMDGRKHSLNELFSIVDNANRYFERGNYEKSIALCRRALDKFGGSADVTVLAKIYFMWVLASMRNDQYDEIDNIIEEANERIGEYLDLDFMRVMSAFGRQDCEGTLLLVEKYADAHAHTDPATDSLLKQSYDSLNEIYWLGAEAAGKLNDVEKCLAFMKKSLDIRPDNHFHRVEYASFLAKQMKANQALETIEEGIKRYPDQMALRNAKGYLLGELKRFGEAEEYIQQHLKKHPDDTDALNNLGVIYDSQGKYDLAGQQFRKVLKIEPDNQTAQSNLQYIDNTVDNKTQTISACMIVKNEENFLPGCLESIKGLVDELIIVDTGSADRTMEIAREYGAKIYEHPWQNDFSLHRNQSMDYATCDWILIIDADEELDPAEHETIRMATKRKDIDAISFVVYNKIQLGRVGFLNSHRLFRNGKGFKYHGIVHNQLEITGKTLMSQFKVIHHGYGLSDEQMEKKGRRSEALLLKQLEDNPELVFPHFNLAQIYRGLGEPEKSLEHAKIVVEKITLDDLDHRHVRLMAMDQMGCAYIGLEQFDEAEKTFKEALEIREDYMDPLFNLGFMYMRQRRYEEAEDVFNRYLKARGAYHPETEWMGLILNNLNSQFAVYYSLGFIHYLRNEVDKALEFFERSAKETEDFEYLHHLLARCYRDRGEFPKILEHSRKAIEHGHDDTEIRLLQGEAYLNLGNADEARKCFTRALAMQPDNEDARLGLVGADSLDKEPQELLKSIDEFLAKSPYSPQGLASKGDVLFIIGDYARAKESYQRAADKYPHDFKVLNNLGNCFLKERNFASAESCYLMALQRNRQFLPGYRNLAVALISQDKISDAAEYLEFYIYNNPNDHEIHATLGDIYYKTREYPKAIGHFERYLSVYSSNLDALIRLSDCYFNLGKLKAAAAGYQAVLGKNSQNETARQRLKEISGFLELQTSE